MPGRWTEVLWASLKLGLTSFGGPVAHLGYFHREYVVRRRWLDEERYTELVALCQLLPGPASSQLGIAIGVGRAGLWGGLAAWLGFTAPSAVLMAGFALVMGTVDAGQAAWLHGLKLVALAVVFQAVVGLWTTLASRKGTAAVAVAAACVSLLSAIPLTQMVVLAAGGAVGAALFRGGEPRPFEPWKLTYRRTTGAVLLGLFGVLLLGLPLLAAAVPDPLLRWADHLYRSGALVFGGGHVVLPLLQNEVVASGLVSNDVFLAGYGAAQAVPGPLFTIAAFLGAAAQGPVGALVAVTAIFLPGALIVVGILPFWSTLRTSRLLRGVLTGVNAAVVGILLAALYHPIFTTAVRGPGDLALALALVLLLMVWNVAPWIVVGLGAVGATLLAPWAFSP